jgi:ribA/ribD-fused uncharacterized protein
MSILFYVPNDKYGFLSNFSPHGIEMNGAWYPTVEHYFQAQKFGDENYCEKIRTARTPRDAKNLGRTREFPLRADWEEVKDEVMYQACLKKFQTHDEIRAALLRTKNEKLIENAPSDYYWGCGANGTGKNRLGEILMRVREELCG